MSEDIKENIEKKLEENEETIKPEEERLGATGQIILGEIEKIGGILTANPTAQAQGDYNIEAGNLRREVAEELVKSDTEEEQ